MSHKSDDEPLATRVAAAIQRNQLSVWLDTADPNINGDGPHLAEYIESVIRGSRALMAVVTENTHKSWWVPFEIGVAFELRRYLSSFGNKNLNPSFLAKWPNVPDNPPGRPSENRYLDYWCVQLRRAPASPDMKTYMTELRAMM